MNIATDELADYVAQLVARTAEGGIGWSPVSPSAFAAVRDTPSGKKRMTLTRARRPEKELRGTLETIGASVRRLREADFLFQVESLVPDKRIELAIDTRERPGLTQAFEGLFNAARSSVDAQSARVLKELVG